MLDFHTILFPKNSRTSKISRREKGLNIRIREEGESHPSLVGMLGAAPLRVLGAVGTGALGARGHVSQGSPRHTSGVMPPSPFCAGSPVGERKRWGPPPGRLDPSQWPPEQVAGGARTPILASGTWATLTSGHPSGPRVSPPEPLGPTGVFLMV